MSVKNPVRALDPEVARKIAAGEVIDRPNAIIRELIDNAVDAGATFITVEIEGGGIEKIRIIDDGCGMTKEDLMCCAHPHSTSKISTEVDLMNLSTLGFRGEALASVAAVARLSIISGGWKMRASITEDHILQQVAETKGTIVQAEGLFENFPARRQFLKRAATEGTMCKNTFVEKAMARPDIGFRFIQDNVTKIDLPAGQSLKERFVMACGYRENSGLFYQFGNSSDNSLYNNSNCQWTGDLGQEIENKNTEEQPEWSFQVVIGEPSVSRSNKKDIFIYANGRRIQEYSLVQAVEYGGQGYFPNGTYPVAAVFVQVRPDLVDFNIHPAKKEARFSDLGPLHHGISSTIKGFFLKYTQQNFANNETADGVNINEFDFTPSDNIFDTPDTPPIKNESEENTPAAISEENKKSGLDSLGYFSHPGKNIAYKENITPQNDIGDFRSRYIGNTTINSNQNNKTYKDLSSSSRNSSASKSNLSGEYHNYYHSPTLSLADQALQAQATTDKQETATSDTQNTSTSIKATLTGSLLPKDPGKIRYIGACLGTFLLAEKDNCLYIIDQHAAHERILFDKLMNSQTKAKSQQLLIPYNFTTESKAQDKLMETLSPELSRIGFEAKRKDETHWEITSIPERWTGTEHDLRNLIFVKQVEPKEIIRSIAAMTSCKAAIKDGYIIDNITATQLITEAFKLEDPHCPHGRPIYTVISREKLFQLVKRT